MKFIQVNLIRSILAAVLLSAGAGAAMAYDHDDKGWFDDQHHHHAFVHHNGHRGYWDHDKSGAKIFINVWFPQPAACPSGWPVENKSRSA